MTVKSDYSNCGMKGIHNLSGDPAVDVRSVVINWEGYNLFYFSDGVKAPGPKLAKYIEDNKLGTIIASEKVNNPVHGSEENPWYIQAFFWHPDWDACKEWLKQKDKPKDIFEAPAPKAVPQPEAIHRIRKEFSL
jgi:hypothetical protein